MKLPTNLSARIPVASATGILFSFQVLNASDLGEVSLITNRILMLHFDDGHIDYHHPLDPIEAVDRSNYLFMN